MNRLMITCLSLMVAFGIASAQTGNNSPQQPQRPDSIRPHLTTEQKAQAITRHMAKAYDLSQEQEAKLLELNTRALQRHNNKPRANRPNTDFKRDSLRPNHPNKDFKRDSLRANRPNKDFKQGGAPRPNKGWKQGQPRRGNDYVRALSQILTPEQFRAYLTDKSIERAINPTQGFRPMPRRGFNAPCCGNPNGPRQNFNRCPGAPEPSCGANGPAPQFQNGQPAPDNNQKGNNQKGNKKKNKNKKNKNRDQSNNPHD